MENSSKQQKFAGHIQIVKTPSLARQIQPGIRISVLVLRVESELRRLRQAYASYQATRRRNAVFDYMTAVFNFIARWKQEHRLPQSLDLVRKMRNNVAHTRTNDPYTNLIAFTSDPQKTDSKTRSKWARALRCAEATKSKGETLAEFIQRKGGINECAAQWSDRFR